MSRAAAAALAVLLVTACTGGDRTAGPRIDTVLDTVDVDDAVGTDVVFYDLATAPDGPPVALVGAAGADQSWLVRLPSGATTAIPAVEPDSELVITDDGTPLIVGTALTPVGGAVLPLPLGGPPAAVLLAGDTLYLARDTRLAAVDAGTGAVRTTAAAPGPVTHLARAPDGGLTALVDQDGVVLLRLTPDLRPHGDPVELDPDGSGTPTALRVTADGTVVAAMYVNEALDAGRLVTVVDGRVRTVADLEGTDDTALDLAVDPPGRVAYVVLSASYHPAELTAIDLATGERTATVALCGGAGAFGAIAPSADGSTLTVAGSCIDDGGPSTTAFVIG
ncbi:hypothetical protein [Geodermatophilus maliterrae]|uniref:DNA-binding beta-propeller fold protein YncE n=1 Tax=Geodermatophilus maliterrae TaxID=3162531 RepID=A0ABV3XDD9_9ACTN